MLFFCVVGWVEAWKTSINRKNYSAHWLNGRSLLVGWINSTALTSDWNLIITFLLPVLGTVKF